MAVLVPCTTVLVLCMTVLVQYLTCAIVVYTISIFLASIKIIGISRSTDANRTVGFALHECLAEVPVRQDSYLPPTTFWTLNQSALQTHVTGYEYL